MSFTEIYGFDRNGKAYFLGEVRNAWRGAMAVWKLIEKRYMSSWQPAWAKGLDEEYSRVIDMNAVGEIWSMFGTDKLSWVDKVVLGSTFDNAIVMKKDIPELLKCFREFEGETSLKEQADLIEKALNGDEPPEAVAWNATSVNSDNWLNYGGYDEEKEEQIPYNLKTGDRHWDLFERISSEEK